MTEEDARAIVERDAKSKESRNAYMRRRYAEQCKTRDTARAALGLPPTRKHPRAQVTFPDGLVFNFPRGVVYQKIPVGAQTIRERWDSLLAEFPVSPEKWFFDWPDPRPGRSAEIYRITFLP